MWYVFATFVMQNLFDTIKNAAAGLASNHEVITIIILVIVVQILSQIINLITFLVSQPLKVKIKGALDRQIHDKTIRLKALSFEDADTFFPAIDYTKWAETERQAFPADERHAYPFSFFIYERINRV